MVDIVPALEANNGEASSRVEVEGIKIAEGRDVNVVSRSHSSFGATGKILLADFLWSLQVPTEKRHPDLTEPSNWHPHQKPAP
jgi:hypothetical protein